MDAATRGLGLPRMEGKLSIEVFSKVHQVYASFCCVF